MVKNPGVSDVAPASEIRYTPIAPVVKRKRRASCLGEQERKERKRAIDREAQRSLREKTKTHIAELERTIQILRGQDHNSAIARLMSEIDSLRSENERLRDIIDNVKNLVGVEIAPRPSPNEKQTAKKGDVTVTSPESNIDYRSPKQQANPTPQEPASPADSKPPLPTPNSLFSEPETTAYEFMAFPPMPTTRTINVNGMSVMTDLDPTGLPLTVPINFSAISSITEENPLLSHPESPTTAAFAPFIAEFFGPS